MLKRRIISVLMVLLVALGVTLPGSFSTTAGKGNVAKENTEEVTAGYLGPERKNISIKD